jgi:hypothetical protein
MNNNKSKQPKKVYRLAVYGLSASGKTCVLAALAMSRDPHPLQYSCTQIPASKKSSQALQAGQKWIEQATENLLQQKVPEANSLGEEDFMLEYDFIGTHQTFRIELLDYTGELIDIDSANREELASLAQKLRKQFAKMDGILVLAEAPYWDMLGHLQGSQKTRYDEAHLNLHRLRKAFALLRGEKQDGAALDTTPVALLVNKWDRYSQIDFNNPELEHSQLEEFLNASPPPPHRGLRDELSGALTEGNFKAFPISALGPSQFKRLENGEVVERPLQTLPLRSFGLEDPFIWIAQRRDAIDLQDYQAKKNWRRCWGKRGSELLNRFPVGSEPAKQVEKVLQQCRKEKILTGLGVSVVIIVLGLATETIVDHHQYVQHQATTSNSGVTERQLESAENWFDKYVKAPYLRHLVSRKTFLSRELADNKLKELQHRRENVLWELVTKAVATNNLQAAATHAETYLRSYRYGTHSVEARSIGLQAKNELSMREDSEAVRRITSLMQENWKNSVQLNQILAELRTLPKHPEVETEDMRTQRIALDQQLSTRLQEIIAFRKADEEAVRQIASLMQENQQDPDKLNQILAELRTLPKHPGVETDEMRGQRTGLEQRLFARQQEVIEFRKADEEAVRRITSLKQENQQDPNKLNQILADLRTLPKHPEVETGEMRTQRIALDQQLSKQVIEVANRRDWEQFYQGYQNNMQSGNFSEAAQSLTNRPGDDRVNQLKETFKTMVVQQIAERVAQTLQDNRFNEAHRFIKDYAQFPPDLQSVEGQVKVAELQRQIDAREDQQWYEVAKKYRDVEHLNKYLQDAPLKTMQQEVAAYKDYLGKIDPNATVNIQLVVTINWGIESDEMDVSVFWNGSVITTAQGMKSESYSSTGILRSGFLSAKSYDKVTVRIKVTEYDWGNDYYEGSVTKELSELPTVSVSLRDSDNEKAGTAHLSLSGYPSPPELPEWHGVR